MKPFWLRLIPYGTLFGVLLILLFGIPRFIIVFRANMNGDYSVLSLVFLFMWITPFVFLTRQGRTGMGMRKPSKPIWLLYAVVLGVIACVVVYLIGTVLYDTSISNWFEYISWSYQHQLTSASPDDKIIYFFIFSLIGMTFSPIGEELLYRGIIHQSIARSHGKTTATIADGSAFALTHLAHFGIVFHDQQWSLLVVPAFLWVILMFLVSLLFSICRDRSGSIVGAIICHAAFNVMMMYCIFWWVM